MTEQAAAVPGAEWNAHAYTRLSNPMQTWGEAILERLTLRGDETALDLGCGSGRLTEYLLRRLPRGRVIAVDRSENMLQAAREHLEPEFGGRVEYVQKSLDELDMHQVAELAFSNAAFHWIKDHPRLFRAIFAALRPGGWLIAQCGAEPNIARVRARAGEIMQSAPYRTYFEGWPGPWEFATPEVTRERLLGAGFVDVETSMFEAPVQLSSAAETRDYFENVILGTHLARIGDVDQRAAFVDCMTEQSAADEPAFRQDYWRLNLRARRPAS
ncbi:MAG: methyltransferase domain-containing protein [Chloroflexota bacterium]|nr:methyltransferase domain-containing protein [Chloroflexota bacterium]